MSESEVNAADEEIVFTTEEEAQAGRQLGLKLFNDGMYEEALAPQVAVIVYYTSKYGESHASCGIYYLDYGITLLSIIQGKTTGSETGVDAAAQAALTAIDSEDAELCFLNLELARVCFEKAERADESDVEVQCRLAEVHDALAQFALEQDDSSAALAEFQTALITLQSLPGNASEEVKNQNACASAMFNIARCYIQEADFVNGAEKLKELLEYVSAVNLKNPGTISEDMKEEIQLFYDECKEDCNSKTFYKAQQAIQELYPDEKQEVPDPSEVLDKSNPYLSVLPGCTDNPTSVSGHSLMVTPVPYSSVGEVSNSVSRSIFPTQGTGDRSKKSISNSEGPVNIVVAVKKNSKKGNDLESALKKARLE
eukprot:Tbor_TRINITY_DN9503_c0_g1::TRINITY_DN9503_c0_g1_i1::g.15690::m.15690